MTTKSKSRPDPTDTLHRLGELVEAKRLPVVSVPESRAAIRAGAVRVRRPRWWVQVQRSLGCAAPAEVVNLSRWVEAAAVELGVEVADVVAALGRFEDVEG